MATLVKNLNPNVLVWARESVHLNFDDIPKSVVSPDKLKKVEAGEDFLTLIQLEKLAKKYDRALMVLLGESIPSDDYAKLPVFRRTDQYAYDSALALFIRDIQKKQSWARNYLMEEGFVELDFVGSVKLTDNKKEAASYIKERLQLPSYYDFGRNVDYFKALKTALEKCHVFVSVAGSNKSNKPISLSNAQGFAIPDEVAPFVFINTKNTDNAKIFTLIHELVHVFVNEEGISDDVIKFRTPTCREDEIENFCNMVAGELLMPETDFISAYKSISLKSSLRDTVNSLSRKFLVSELAICVRLWRLSFLSYGEYQDLYSSISDEIRDYLKDKTARMKEGNGGNYYASMMSKNGSLLSELAYFAYKGNKILGKDLYHVLNVKLDKLNNYFSVMST